MALKKKIYKFLDIGVKIWVVNWFQQNLQRWLTNRKANSFKDAIVVAKSDFGADVNSI